ncbi:trimeric intracellular cation channel family protein [Pelagicoccus sp. SDUM812003]|uniref:trimeric intracellular cation channel family protein n=1 Tax=Pelagicoccus sp. SDUM812003 TaxID=3041267 RepID=UPI00280FBA4B|nr:trimeric intracellular cation channel family protein [Pelagicoccus sp. SDUM812003]MDQ8201789.1 trimeric intracellular cation channel family protein [Pelagicoccus sp. SDUM812003]
MLHALDIFGTIVFALTGVFAAGRNNLDLFGALVLAFVTAVGGGTLRDLILGVPVFWLPNPLYLYLILGTWAGALIAARITRHIPRGTILWSDALGLSAFTVMGTAKALENGQTAAVAILMGTLTSVAGGLIRDLLAGRQPMVLNQQRLYATASIAGCAVFVTLQPWSQQWATLAAMAATFTLRAGALLWDWKLPIYPTNAEHGD